jgi:MFS family permease
VLFVARLLTAEEPFIPLAVMFNPVVAAGTASNFFVMGTLVALSIYVPIYFEAVLGLSAAQSGLALIALMGGTVTGAQIAGRVMMWTPHYKRGPVFGLLVSIVAVSALAAGAPFLPLWGVEVLLAIGGIGLGTAFPVATISIQNAVEPHQLGTATASFNFFRSLGSAIFVAAFGAIFIGGLGIGGQAIGSLDALVAAAAHQGTAIGSVFRYVFGAAAVTLAVGFLCIAAMRELPLRAQ